MTTEQMVMRDEVPQARRREKPAAGRPSDRLSREGQIKALKARDNTTNFFHLAFDYAVLIATVAATLWSYSLVADAGLDWWWNAPATIVAVIIIGAVQHQFGGATHEGTHYMLFDDRKLNELTSDWLAAFPIYTSTYAFRLHHLAHHQFVNDPERDPNFDQAKDSGHGSTFRLSISNC